MSDVIISSSNLIGTVNAIPSKSYSHRAIICAALSGGECKVSPLVFSEDVLVTINAVKKIGVQVVKLNDGIILKGGFGRIKGDIVIDCLDCGSTLRFLIPIVSAFGLRATFRRSISLAKRPLGEYLEVLSEFGMNYKVNSDLSVSISGQLRSGEFKIPGGISSQFISGLLMALPLLKGDSEIVLTSELQSSNYVDMTIDVLKKFGITVGKTDRGFFIKGGQKYTPANYEVEGDWSQAAFFLVGGALSGDITVKNLNKNSLQGDKKIYEILERFGVKIFWVKSGLNVKKSSLKGIDIDASQIPDLVPILSVLCSNSSGISRITNAERLKFKECNRLEAIYKELKNLGVDIKKQTDGLTITGGNKSSGSGLVWSHNDHRIAMALAIMGLNLPKSMKIIDADSVNKSYPNFFEDFKSIGGKAYVVDVGQ